MLKREIARWDLVLLLINGIIGAGIFGLPAKIYASMGVYSIVAIFTCALLVFILILNFAEVSSRFNQTGGPYLYALKAFGEWPGFFMGWLLLITRVASFAALLNLSISYLAFFIEDLNSSIGRFVGILSITLILTFINYRGIQHSTRVNNGLGIAKLLPLLLFIGLGFFFIQGESLNFSSSLPSLGDTSSTVLILIFAFTGFESVIVNSGEFKNPQKDLPFALMVSILIIALFYIAIQIVSIGTLDNLADSDRPLTDASRVFMGENGAILISLGAIISILGTLNAVSLVGSRLAYALSIEKQFPTLFAQVHPQYRSPVYSLLFFMTLGFLMALSGSFIYAATISAISKILMFIIVSAALIQLRRSEKSNAPRYFRLRFGYFWAIFGMISSALLLLSAKSQELLATLVALSIGAIFYAFFRKFRARKS